MYPRLPKALDKRCKLTDVDIGLIRRDFAEGVKMKELAKEFAVSLTLIKYWTDENYRKKVIEQTKNRMKGKKRTKNDLLKIKATDRERNSRPEYKEYKKQENIRRRPAEKMARKIERNKKMVEEARNLLEANGYLISKKYYLSKPKYEKE